jgi:hypothetical protein
LTVACILSLISIFCGISIVYWGLQSFFAITALVLVPPVAYLIVVHPKSGIFILLTLAYILMFFTRLGITFPVGTIIDAVEGLLVLGLLLKQKAERNWSTFRNSIGTIIIIWIGYNILQIANPDAESKLAWIYTIRSIAIVAITYFIFLYHIRDVRFIRNILKLWIALSLIAACYAFKQEFIGFSVFEQQWLSSDPSYTDLYYIGNHWRKFSLFTDPMTFAYNMAISSIMCFSLATGPLSRKKKVALILFGCFFFAAMLFSGTRSAYVLLPVAFILYLILKFSKRLLLFTIIIGGITAGLILMPTSNYTLYRFQTAFKPSNDASYNLRKVNQEKIQPYILAHPIGGGLGSTGIWGKRFSPDSYLANFPPDSGYVRIAVELGWIGLFLFCTFMFIILRQGIINYFNIKDPELKMYCFAMLMVIFSLNIGNYPQEAIVQYPTNIYFYLAASLIVVCYRLDMAKQVLDNEKNGKGNIKLAI